jgi:hypothetical protein
VPKPKRTRRVGREQARRYVAKAEEFLEAADIELDANRSLAATSLAIHATINAGDAVAGLRLGERAAGTTHEEAARVLRSAGRDGTAVAKELERVLPLKTRAEYEPTDVPKSKAAAAVRAAHRAVEVAIRVLAEAERT